MQIPLPPLSLTLLTLLTSVYALGPTDAFTDEVFGEPTGKDSGNTLCGGACVIDPNSLPCGHIEVCISLFFASCFRSSLLPHDALILTCLF